jgi:hypothetical protein
MLELRNRAYGGKLEWLRWPRLRISFISTNGKTGPSERLRSISGFRGGQWIAWWPTPTDVCQSRSLSIARRQRRPPRSCIIESDKKINRKQRHTSRRIWERVVEEFGEDSSPAESTVRRHVGKVKKRNPEPFIPLGFVAGQSMQGDFGEVTAKIGGEKCKLYFWAQRLSYSRATCAGVLSGRPATGPAVLRWRPGDAYHRQSEGRYKSGLGRNAVETERYDAFQTHYGFGTEVRQTHKPENEMLSKNQPHHRWFFSCRGKHVGCGF